MLVLFIDDDKEDYEVFCEALKGIVRNTKCLYASNGLEALDLLTNQLPFLPDYIFLDINMPLMGGEECLELIKFHPTVKDVPVIMYSTTENRDEIERFKKLGAKDFIIKAPTFMGLVNSIKRVLVQ